MNQTSRPLLTNFTRVLPQCSLTVRRRESHRTVTSNRHSAKSHRRLAKSLDRPKRQPARPSGRRESRSCQWGDADMTFTSHANESFSVRQRNVQLSSAAAGPPISIRSTSVLERSRGCNNSTDARSASDISKPLVISILGFDETLHHALPVLVAEAWVACNER